MAESITFSLPERKAWDPDAVSAHPQSKCVCNSDVPPPPPDRIFNQLPLLPSGPIRWYSSDSVFGRAGGMFLPSPNSGCEPKWRATGTPATREISVEPGQGGPFGWDAYVSAMQMLKEHDERIRDAGAIQAMSFGESFESAEQRLFDVLAEIEDVSYEMHRADAKGDAIEAGELAKELKALNSRRLEIEKYLNKKAKKEYEKAGIERGKLWCHYFRVSRYQFSDDAKRLSEGEPLRVWHSFDGIAPFGPEKLKQLEFQELMKRQIKRDEQIIEELIAAGRTARELVELSRLTATDPVSKVYIEQKVDELIPKQPVATKSRGDIEANVRHLTGAPTQTLVGANDPSLVILKNPSLPPTPDNILSPEELQERELRIAENIVDDAAEYYREEIQRASEPEKWRADYEYWRIHYPTVRINPDQNPHVEPRLLRNPWNPDRGIAPLVNVEFYPRKKKKPKKGVFMKLADFLGPAAGIILAPIPVVGPALAIGASVAIGQATIKDMKDWAEEIGEFPPSAFAPQFEPEPFTVPLPLDRAQILLKEPWFSAQMVNQFVQETKDQRIRDLNEAYLQLAGQSLAKREPEEFSQPGMTSPFEGLPSQTQTGIGSLDDFKDIFYDPNMDATRALKPKTIQTAALIGVGVIALLALMKKR